MEKTIGMRVIAGKYKRRALVTVPGQDTTRPTSDRIKENMFNLVSGYLDNAVVLDLFSGSGALGIEALSRGAQQVIFVEKNPLAIKAIETNLAQLGIDKSQYHIVRSDVDAFLSAESTKGLPLAHVIFADPPYKNGWYSRALDQLSKASRLAEQVIFIVEMPKEIELSQTAHQHHWTLLQSRDYGRTRIEIWKKELTVSTCVG